MRPWRTVAHLWLAGAFAALGHGFRYEAPASAAQGRPVDAARMITLPAPEAPPSSATDPLIGRYTLDINVPATSGTRCETIPPHERTRTYTADIHPFRDYYAVKLYDAIFLRDGPRIDDLCSDSRLEMGGICHQFILKRSGESSVSIVMTAEGDWTKGNQISEILREEARLLQIHGQGNGSYGDGRIVASGSGAVWSGNGLPASEYASCRSDQMTWAFRRR